MVTEASQISDLTNLSRVDEFCTRGREQNDGAGNILRSRSHIDWAVVHVETFGTASSDLADHQRILKTRLELPRRLHGRNRKTPSAHRRCCNRNSSGPDHVDHHNCVAFTVKLNILRKTVDHDRFAHLFTFTIYDWPHVIDAEQTAADSLAKMRRNAGPGGKFPLAKPLPALRCTSEPHGRNG